MQILRTFIVAAMAAVQTAHAPVRTDPVLVRVVFDGDTIDVATVGRVRLLGIDAPEIGHRFDSSAPFGREAKERLTSLIAHRWVRLEFDGQREDLYRSSPRVRAARGRDVGQCAPRPGRARSRVDPCAARAPGGTATRRSRCSGPPPWHVVDEPLRGAKLPRRIR